MEAADESVPHWQGWLFALLAASAIGGVLSLVPRPQTALMGEISTAAAPTTPPPAVLPVEYIPLAPTDAVAANSAVAFATRDFPAATPFLFSGGADDRQRALECLSAAVLYEAGDDAKGQRAVAQVIINRSRNPAFPKSICGVVFQGSERRTGCQFTFTCDGALARSWSDAAWMRARYVADTALSGSVDPTVGLATHYHTDWVRPYWSDSLQKIAAVDTHLFFRWPGYWGTPAAFRTTLPGNEPIVAKLAGRSSVHGSVIAPPMTPELAATANVAPVGEARVVTQAAAGTRDAVYVTLDRRAPPESYVTLALKLCGARTYCKFMGWTNPMFTPADDNVDATARQAMSFSYLRDEATGFEKAMWNCEEFARDDKRQCMKR